MSLQIGKAVYNILSNSKDVVAKVNNKIYPLVAENETTFPFIIYKRTGIEQISSKDKFVFSEDVQVTIMIASDKYNESIELADLVKTALINKKNFKETDIQEISLYDADEDYIQDTFIQNLIFNIRIQYGK